MPALRSLLSLLISGLSLGGWWYSSSVSGSRDGTATMRDIDRAIDTTTPQQAQAFVSGKTWRTVEGSSPQQVHYSTPDGRDFLWMAEQPRIIAGEWRIESAADNRGRTVTKLCLRYAGEAVHPTSKEAGANWHCRAAGMVFHWIRERADGDPLQLAERSQVPTFSNYSRETIRQLQTKIGR